MKRSPAVCLLVAVLASSCSPKRLAVNALGNAIASGSSSSFASDDDPELVGEAVPFALKTIESLLASSPRHRPLLEAAAGGFTQYAFVWLDQEADFVESADFARATHLRERAKRLYLRARDYGLRGLALRQADLPERLHTADPQAAAAALRVTRKEDVPFLYWTAASWGGAIGLAVNDSELAAAIPVVEALARRALELDEGWDRGVLHALLLSVEASRASVGGSLPEARKHYERAQELAGGGRGLLYVNFAESIAVPTQDRAAFEAALRAALAIDVDKVPADRLANVVAQKRARWLLAQADELFVE